MLSYSFTYLFFNLMHTLYDRWRFSSKDTLQGRVFPGRLATYPGGGYWRELSDNKRESKRMVQDLAVSENNFLYHQDMDR